MGARARTSKRRASNDYYLGRPAIDRVIIRFVPDPNALIANVLGEAIDVVISDAIDVSRALEVRSAGRGTGNRVQFHELEGLHQLESAAPTGHGTAAQRFYTVRAVRQALVPGNRSHTLADVVAGGVAPVADSWYSPSHPPLRPQLESTIPQFRTTSAARGRCWPRRVDSRAGRRAGECRDRGALRDGHHVEARDGCRAGPGAIAEWLKQVGVQAEFDILTVANQDAPRVPVSPAGPYFTSPSGINFYDNRLNSDAITRAENR
jgi:hypothetical protein